MLEIVCRRVASAYYEGVRKIIKKICFSEDLKLEKLLRYTHPVQLQSEKFLRKFSPQHLKSYFLACLLSWTDPSSIHNVTIHWEGSHPEDIGSSGVIK